MITRHPLTLTRTLTRSVLALSLFSALLISTHGYAAPTSTVGVLADQSRIHVKGLKTFTETEVKRQLFGDMDVAMRGVPSSPKLEYIDALKRRLSAGLMFAGFVDCQISAQPSFAGDRLTLTVTEGERYLAGSVDITGLSASALDRVKSTAQYRSITENLWRKGEPAKYQETLPKSYQEQAQRMLAELGHFSNDLEVTLQPDADQHTVSLKVEVRRLGARGQLRRVKIDGVSEEYHPIVRKILKLKTGQDLNALILDEAVKRLRESGRFYRVEYETQPVEAQSERGDTQIDVTLKIKTHPALPPLDQKLSAAQGAMLKLSAWSPSLNTSRTALRFSVRKELDFAGLDGVEVGVSSQEGLMITSRINQGERLFVFKPSLIGFYAPDLKQSCIARDLKQKLRLEVGVQLNESDPDNPLSLNLQVAATQKGDEQFKLNAGYSPGASIVTGQRLVEVKSESPTRALLQSRPEESQGGVQLWSINRESGRLVSLIIKEEDKETLKVWTTEDGLSELAEGALNQQMKNVYDPARPVWSCMGFAMRHFIPLDRLVEDPQRTKELQDAIPVLSQLSKDVIDTLIPSMDDEGADRFEIPESSVSRDQLMTTLMVNIAQYIQGSLEPASWPWTLAQQASMVILGNTGSLPLELQRVSQDPKIGPLGRLAFAYVMKYIGHPASAYFAQQGLRQLSHESLSLDLALLYRGAARLARAGRVFFTALRECSERDQKSLAQLFPSASRGAFIKAMTALRDPQHESVEDAAYAMMNVWIAEGLQAWVGAQLKAFSP